VVLERMTSKFAIHYCGIGDCTIFNQSYRGVEDGHDHPPAKKVHAPYGRLTRPGFDEALMVLFSKTSYMTIFILPLPGGR
jgi:hypothetical protein